MRKDAAVPIDCKSYDVPMQSISRKVGIRCLPEDMDSAFILYEGEHFPIRATDKKEKDCFQSDDFRQMSSRLSYVRDVRGIGVFTAQPGHPERPETDHEPRL